MAKNGYEKNLAQFFCVLPGVNTVGVMGDHRTYDNLVAIRAVTTDDFMTADWAKIPYDILAKVSNRITNEVKHVNRVVYDITSKPPAPSSGSNSAISINALFIRRSRVLQP